MLARSLSVGAVRAKLHGHSPKELARTERTKIAAVAAVLRLTAEQPQVMLIRRAVDPNDHWSGHMAFPGGRMESSDATSLRTAVRETREEVAVDLDACGELLGRLDDVQAVSKGVARDMLIVPYVFALTREVTPRIDQREVAEVRWASLSPMIAGEVDAVRPYVRDGKRLDLPGYHVGPHIVWGLTYQMLDLLFDVIRG